MNILFTTNHPVIRFGLQPALEQLGVKTADFQIKQCPQNRRATLAEKVINTFKPDVVFSAGFVAPHLDELLLFLDRYSIPHVYWATEDPVLFEPFGLPVGKHSALVLTTTEELIPVYQKHEIRADFLPFACNPNLHKKVAPVPEFQHDIVYVGSNYKRRLKAINTIINPLVKAGYDLKVWGHWWNNKEMPYQLPAGNYAGLLPYHKLAQVYSSAKIVLGMHAVDTSKSHSSRRTYEVLGCGAFYLTQYTPTHETLFENRKHLVWSKSAEETLELVDYYLRHDDERQQIAVNGQEEVYAKHTYAHRAEKVINTLKSL
ncbi:MAG: glycosyltransferase [Thermoanaerobacteraceae bacterium]|nr:glycosyltransferase [Thermoanaerobacteraceae bacterium]